MSGRRGAVDIPARLPARWRHPASENLITEKHTIEYHRMMC
jgi:hypothetical protein